jgi:poly(3-hydroxybutyrate) depolymerase
MKNRNCVSLLIFAAALLIITAQSTLASDKVVKESIESQGKKRTIYVFAPESAKAKGPAPLVVLLHGSGRTVVSLVYNWKDLAAR